MYKQPRNFLDMSFQWVSIFGQNGKISEKN